MIGRTPHLPEDRLLDCYVAERTGESLEPRAAEHLESCPTCDTRYTELVSFMNDLRTVAHEQAEAVFTPDRLQEQRQQVSRRIEHLGQAARVLSFPSRLVGRGMRSTAARIAPRWVAAAAGIGLFVGVTLASLYDLGHPAGADRAQSRLAAVQGPKTTAVLPVSGHPMPPSLDADAFLSKLEMVLDGPGTQELMPFEALTPHIRDIRTRIR